MLASSGRVIAIAPTSQSGFGSKGDLGGDPPQSIARALRIDAGSQTDAGGA